jgi:hypothetical protein
MGYQNYSDYTFSYNKENHNCSKIISNKIKLIKLLIDNTKKFSIIWNKENDYYVSRFSDKEIKIYNNTKTRIVFIMINGNKLDLDNKEFLKLVELINTLNLFFKKIEINDLINDTIKILENK